MLWENPVTTKIPSEWNLSSCRRQTPRRFPNLTPRPFYQRNFTFLLADATCTHTLLRPLILRTRV